ncbi:MAG: LytTR family DNA-binding domain-containing protein [Rhodoferax sp.]|jgi:two-component system response regulator AlgR
MTLRALIVDDEPLARARLRTLLGECPAPRVQVEGEAGNAAQALALLARQTFDVALLDVHMPGADGMALARSLQALPQPPAIVFVTAHAEHAVQAFEIEAVDYLTKPVRLSRLTLALQKVERALQRQVPEAAAQEFLTIQDRGRTERVPLQDVAYLKAELKYVTVRTAERSYILDASLSELEEKFGAQFLRIHRNALVTRRLVRALEKHYDDEEGEGWAVRLQGIDEPLAVSRRQLAAVRELLGAPR